MVAIVRFMKTVLALFVDDGAVQQHFINVFSDAVHAVFIFGDFAGFAGPGARGILGRVADNVGRGDGIAVDGEVGLDLGAERVV